MPQKVQPNLMWPERILIQCIGALWASYTCAAAFRNPLTAEETFPESEMGGFGTAKGGNTAFDVAVKIVEYTLSRGIGGVTEETEKVREQILSRSDWLKNLTEDPYFKALQDQAC